MPRKPNYQYEKRQKELERQARKAEKLQRRQERAASNEETAPDDGDAALPTDGAPGADSPHGAGQQTA